MTDTPRTLEELQTILADNATRSISAQDLRDLMISIAQPIPGAGFLGAKPYESISFANTSGAAVTLPNNGATYGDIVVAPYGSNRPGGAEARRGRDLISASYSLAGSDPTSAYGVDVDAGNAFMLETGVWRVDTLIQAASPGFDWPGAGFPPINAYFDQVSYNPDFSGALDGTEPFYQPAWFNPATVDYQLPIPSYATSKYRTLWTSFVIVQDSPDPQPFALYMYTSPGWSSDVATTFYGVYLQKES